MKINIANGTFLKHKLNFEQQSDIISQLNIDGIELTFRYNDELDSCLKADNFLDFLSKFKYNTIHSPFGKSPDIKIYRKDNIDEVLNKLKNIAAKINARNIVFHIYNFENLPLLNKVNDCLFSVENTITENMNYIELTKIFDKYNKLRFTIDTSHASFIGKKEFDDLFDNLRDKIKTIHFSNAWDDKQHKQFFDRKGIERFSKIKKLGDNVILTVEENFNEKIVESMNTEISFIRNFLKT